MRKLVIFALTASLFGAANCCAEVTPERAEVTIPFPKFAPRPSATTIYCSATLGANVTGRNESADKNSPSAAAIRGLVGAVPHGEQSQSMRIRFGTKQISVGFFVGPLGKAQSLPPVDWPYDIVSDDPTNFYATARILSTFHVIALNRLTGTLIHGSVDASIPEGAHPWGSLTFYVCEATEPK